MKHSKACQDTQESADSLSAQAAWCSDSVHSLKAELSGNACVGAKRVTYKLRGVGVQRCAGSWHIACRRHGRVVLGIRGHAHAKYGLMSSKYRWQIGCKASLQGTLHSGATVRNLSGAMTRRGVLFKGCCKPRQLRWECLAYPTNRYNQVYPKTY